MRSFNIGRLQAAAVFALGLVVGGGFLGGFTPRIQTLDPVMTASVSTPCTSNDAVADFVCRNTWMAQHQYSYR